MLNKKTTILYSILIGIFFASIYGIIHDQLTYTISKEYYTKFKFYQFGLATSGDEALFANPRFYVSVVGVTATWWLGVLIGGILALVGLIHTDAQKMFRITIKAMLLTILIACGTGCIGLLSGMFYLADKGVQWSLPANLIDVKNFIAVGSMHNFSYLGGLLGLLAGILYSIKQKRAIR